ncbi:unnamed protein product [Menidia menidia]|uniref:(Atlantic silverside) hypothetical protein n=1 Tax=Menidia menidia TaxID=238744 RepID=A0A8S4B5F3_9TELE|nr:unnamed protein product [Menidia menidia]
MIKRGDIKMSEPPGCCICLDEITTPASLPCGHCFCLVCIGEYWRIHDSCQCPLCKAGFPDRTRLQTGQAPQTQDAAAPLKAGACGQVLPAVPGLVLRRPSGAALPERRAGTSPSDRRGQEPGGLGVQAPREEAGALLQERPNLHLHQSTGVTASVSQEAAKNKVKWKKSATRGRHACIKASKKLLLFCPQFEKMVAVIFSKQVTLLCCLSPDMASSSNSPGDSGSLQRHLSCSVCIETFKDPVTTACGHTFCRKCLDLHIEHASSSCPLCKTHLNKAPSVNIVLRDIIQLNNKPRRPPPNVFTGAPGGVKCDVCTEPNLKAEKSCLVCLASYCSTHIQNHYSAERLKGHKLMEPVGDMDARACLIHGRPLELFSRSQQKCVCVQCIDRQEEVVSAKEECQAKKAQLDDIKTDFQQKIRERRAKMEEINTALRSCKVTSATRESKKTLFTGFQDQLETVLTIVEAAQKAIVKPLEERRRSLEMEAKGHSKKLKAEIKRLPSPKLTTSLRWRTTSCSYRFPSVAVHSDIMDWTGVKLDTSLSFGTMIKTTTVAMEKIQQELDKLSSIELRRVPKFTVDVKLDPATAHKRLVVSDDGKEVKDGGEEQGLEDSPARFDLFGSVLGLSSFSSGKSYWEVEVGDKTGWDLGVVRGSSSRRGKLKVNPDNGYWALVHYEEENYAAMTEPPLRLSPRAKPKKVGVFVDYEEGLVSFYDVTARSHIYSFHKCSFTDELYPYFSPHVKQDEKNFEPLVISAEKHSESEVEREQIDASSSSV